MGWEGIGWTRLGRDGMGGMGRGGDGTGEIPTHASDVSADILLLLVRTLSHPTHPIPSCPTRPHPIPSHPAPSHPIRHHPIPSHTTLSHPTPFLPILLNPFPSHAEDLESHLNEPIPPEIRSDPHKFEVFVREKLETALRQVRGAYIGAG